jgi:phage terminase large subunit
MMSDTSTEINEIYQPLYSTDKRYIVLTGGRGSLKSFSVHDFILRLTYQIGQGVLFTRWTLTSAHTSIIPEFEAAIDRLGLREDFHITRTDIYNRRTNSFIWFRGLKPQSANQTSALKSLSRVTTWIVEEAEDLIDEKLFNKIDDSIRTKGMQNRVILILNPTTREHWIYKRWFERSLKYIEIDGFKVAVSSHPEVENIHSTYLIGKKYLDEEWLNKAERWRIMAKTGFDPVLNEDIGEVQQEKAKTFYVNNYLGGWLEQAEGVIFTNWETGKFDESHTVMFGLDYGYNPDPTALVKASIDWKHRRIYLKQLIYKTDLSTEQIAELVKAFVTPNDIVIADSAEKRLNVELVQKDIPIVKALKGSDSIRSSILQVQNFKLIIDPESVDLINELNLYAWLENKSGVPMDKHNHLLDAVRYVVQYFLAANGL